MLYILNFDMPLTDGFSKSQGRCETHYVALDIRCYYIFTNSLPSSSLSLRLAWTFLVIGSLSMS